MTATLQSALPAKTYSSEKNRRIAESKRATKERRSKLQARTIEIGIPSAEIARVKDDVEQAFLQAKWYYNAIISHLEDGKLTEFDTKITEVAVKMGKDSDKYEDRKLDVLAAATKQKLRDRVSDSLSSLHALKEKGNKVGKLDYKKEVESLPLRKSGDDFKINRELNMVHVVKLGWFKVRGLKQLPQDAEVANASLVKTARGYKLHITYYDVPTIWNYTPSTIVGLDFGVAVPITDSLGREYDSIIRDDKRLRGLQRKLSRQKKGSSNYMKTIQEIRKCHLDNNRKKDDLANKLVNELLGTHEIIVMQDENLRAWKRLWGKKLHHSILGRVKKKLKKHPRVIILGRWVPTTQYCPSCETLNKHSLDKRVYECACGYSTPRDLHAARNMIRFAVLKPEESRETNTDLDLSWVIEKYPEIFQVRGALEVKHACGA